MSDSEIVDAVDPDAAFGILSDPLRVDILRALWESDSHELSFSELQEAVEVRDSGQFNYHLGKFTGQFVGKTDDGYRLQYAGLRLAGMLVAGAYTKAGTVDPVPINDPCPECERDLSFRYDDGHAIVDCESCGVVSVFGIPPGVFTPYDTEQFPDVTERYIRARMWQESKGFCTYCEGKTDAEVVSAAEATSREYALEELRTTPMVLYDCGRCRKTTGQNLRITLLSHPSVVSFYHDHGMDYREIPFWQFMTVDGRSDIQSDPCRATVTYTAHDERLTLTVDDDLTVLDVERDQQMTVPTED